MGCGATKKKIPNEEPGKILRTTGVPEFDAAYQKCEEALALIKKDQSKLEQAKADFIKALGAEKQYAAK